MIIRLASILLVALGPLWAEGSSKTGLPPELQRGIDRLNAALAAGERLKPQSAGLVTAHIDMDQLVDRTFADVCRDPLDDYKDALDNDQLADLVQVCREQLRTAFAERLQRDFVHHIRELRIRRIIVVGLKSDDDRVSLQLLAEGNTAAHITCRLVNRDQRWLITGIEINQQDLSDHYQELLEDVLGEGYSPPVLLARLAQRDYIVIEDFSSTAAGRLPRDWGHMRDKDKHKPKPYKVQVANGYHYLAAQDTGKSVIIGKFVHWNPRKFPIMTWCWRVNTLPPGGNELVNKLNDSAAGIYVMFSQNWLGVPKQVKYVWSSTLSEGTVGRRNKIFRPWFFVLESGDANLGKWTFEQVDLLKDYHQVFSGGKPKRRTIGVGVLTDANNTDSYAEAYYADFRVWSREAYEGGRVVDYCDRFEERAVDTNSSATLSQLPGSQSGVRQ